MTCSVVALDVMIALGLLAILREGGSSLCFF